MELELFALGLLFSLAFATMTGYYAGGIIVPSYLMFFLHQPGRLAVTMGAAFLALLIARCLSRYVLLFGKRQFVVMILSGAIVVSLISSVIPTLVPMTTEFKVLGWVIPGLIANTFQKQGILITSSAIVVVTVAAYFAGRLLVLLV
jgi:poly-gamma-glutamate biosynthesis protein PgsC/CapC